MDLDEESDLAEVHREEGRVARARVEEENATRGRVVNTRFVAVIAVLEGNRQPGLHECVVGAVHAVKNGRENGNLARREGIGDLSWQSLFVPTASV